MTLLVSQQPDSISTPANASDAVCSSTCASAYTRMAAVVVAVAAPPSAPHVSQGLHPWYPRCLLAAERQHQQLRRCNHQHRGGRRSSTRRPPRRAALGGPRRWR